MKRHCSYQGLFRHWGNPLLCPKNIYTHDQMNTITLVFLHLLLEVTTQGQITQIHRATYMYCIQAPKVLQHHIPEQFLPNIVQLPPLFLTEFHKHVIEYYWFSKHKGSFKPETTSKGITREGMNLERTEQELEYMKN